MAFPKEVSIELEKFDNLYKAKVFRGKLEASACSPNRKGAVIKAMDYFEDKFNKQLQSEVIDG